MRITLVAVGRARSDATTALYRDYTKRLRWPLGLHEIAERRSLPPETRKQREGERLIAAVPTGARVVALDERGKSLDSPAFAALLKRWQDEGVGDLAFVIGGAEGLSGALLARADLTLSFGPMTWPHLLVRVLLAEQLYRAQCILDGHPYHRG
ncbi:MAG TPA: 23S rRNA (pseudouridine(1915)-N(3))-methyltransferase RlmH [Kiloniellales bacterium]